MLKDHLQSPSGTIFPFFWDDDEYWSPFRERISFLNPFWNFLKSQTILWFLTHVYILLKFSKSLIEWSDSFDESWSALSNPSTLSTIIRWSSKGLSNDCIEDTRRSGEL